MSISIKVNHNSVFLTLFVSYVCLALLKVVTGVVELMYMIVPIFGMLLLFPVLLKKKIFISPLFFGGVAMLFGLVLYITRTSDVGGFYPLFMLCYMSLFVLYAKYYGGFDFLRVSNICYILYLSVSLIAYFLLSSYYRSISSELIATPIFHGIEGTPASIDSFSAFVFLINFFYNKKSSRWFMYIATLASIFMAGATTPVLIFLVVFLSYIFLRLFKSFRILVVLFFIVMFGIFYLSSTNDLAHTIILVATNGRNIIWDLQIANLGMFNLFLGDVASSEVEIPWSSGSTNNPHNAFLFIILRFGILFFVFLLVLLLFKARVMSLKQQLLLMAFLAACISNTSVFYISNPFYFYMLSFCLSKGAELKYINKQVIKLLPKKQYNDDLVVLKAF